MLFIILFTYIYFYFFGNIKNDTMIETVDWNYFLFVQVWPSSRITNNDNIKFTNDYFTVHGLWPQYTNGTWPQFCNTTSKFNSSALSLIKMI